MTVIIEVPEPRGERIDRARDAGRFGHVDKPPALNIFPHPVGRPVVAGVQVQIAVIIDVAPGDRLGEPAVNQISHRRNIGEPAPTVVVEQLQRTFFVADDQIQIPVVVVITPRGRLGRSIQPLAGQSAEVRDVGEGAVAVVPQQRIRLVAVLSEPCPPHHKDVNIAVVVDVGVIKVQPAGDADQTGAVGSVIEGSVAPVEE